MKTRQLAKFLAPVYRSYQTNMLPGTFLAVRLQLQVPGVVMERRKETHVSLTWRDSFNQVAAQLMKTSGFDIKVAYVYGSEIHLLIAEDCMMFQRDLQKSVSALAAEATLAFSYMQKHPGTFDCRICGCGTWEYVFDYFSHERTNCRSHAINHLCRYAMQIMFPDAKPEHIDQKMAGMDHDARVAYMKAFGTIHHGGTHLDPWFEHGHILKWTWYKKMVSAEEQVDARRVDMSHAQSNNGLNYHDFFCDAVFNNE